MSTLTYSLQAHGAPFHSHRDGSPRPPGGTEPAWVLPPPASEHAAGTGRAPRSCARGLLPHVTPALVLQRHGLGPQHHHPVIPVEHLGQPSLFARIEPLATPLVDERVEQDAVFDRRLALTNVPEGLV